MFLYLESLKAFESVRKKMKMKFINFEKSTDSFYRFFFEKTDK